MVKKLLLLLVLGTVFLPLSINAATQNSLKLDKDVTVQAGEKANFILTIDLTPQIDQKVTKIEFEVSKVGGSTGLVEYTLMGATNLVFSHPDETKFIITKGNNTNDVITDGDTIAKITIPVNEDCPEGDITVTIKNIKFTYLEEADSSSSSSSEGGDELVSKIISGVDSVKKITVIKRVLSNIAELKSITLSTGVLSPTFAANVYEYNVELRDTVVSTTIKAECNNNCSSINGDNQSWSQKLTFAEGENKTIEIKVISESLKNAEIYKVNISRGPFTKEMVELKSLSALEGTIDPVFAKDVFNYYLSVPFVTEKLSLSYELNDPTSTITITGNENFKPGVEVPVVLKITSDDKKNELTYTIYVTKKEDPSSSEVIEEPSSSNSVIDNKNNKYIIVGSIIAGSLVIIGLSFYFLFKHKKKPKNKNVDNTLKMDNLSTKKPDIAISHDQDVELFELTKEYNSLPKEINDLKNSGSNPKNY